MNMSNYPKVLENLEFVTIKEAGLDWSEENIIKDFGYVSGYLRGYNFEFKHKETGNIAFSSCRYVSGSLVNELKNCYATLFEGNPFYLESLNGYEPTGRVVFRGYFTEHYDVNEREEFIEFASDEIEKMIMEIRTDGSFFWDNSIEENCNEEQLIEI